MRRPPHASLKKKNETTHDIYSLKFCLIRSYEFAKHDKQLYSMLAESQKLNTILSYLKFHKA